MSGSTGEAGPVEPRGSGAEVMAAIDDGPDRRTLVIADVSTDDAWLSMPVACAPWLHAWR